MSLERPARKRFPLPASAGTRELAAQLFGHNPQRRLTLLRAAWPIAVGPELARRTEIIGLERETLRVRVPDERWRRALHRMRRDILSRLRQTAGSLAPGALGLQEVRTAGSEVPPPPAVQPAGPADRPEADDPVPATIEEAARAIADPDLRLQFTRTAARYLRRRSQRPHA